MSYPGRPPDPLIAHVAARLGAGAPVAAVAAETGLSARHLLRRSQAAFGYGPKLLARSAWTRSTSAGSARR